VALGLFDVLVDDDRYRCLHANLFQKKEMAVNALKLQQEDFFDMVLSISVVRNKIEGSLHRN
jgi:hypothetical protein